MSISMVMYSFPNTSSRNVGFDMLPKACFTYFARNSSALTVFFFHAGTAISRIPKRPPPVKSIIPQTILQEYNRNQRSVTIIWRYPEGFPAISYAIPLKRGAVLGHLFFGYIHIWTGMTECAVS